MSIGRYIIKQHNIPGAKAIGMGDDIILASPLYGLTRDQLFKSYADTGFNINLLKTISGPIGEFLRQVYSERGVIGYPASAMSSILYSPPWLENYDMSKEQEIAKNWMTLYSRYLPHCLDTMGLTSIIRSMIKADVRQHFRTKGNLDHWLDTPIPAGGGGPIEWSRPERWCRIEYEDVVTRAKEDFLSLFGIGEVSERRSSKKRIVYMEMEKVKHDARHVRISSVEYEPVIPKMVNKTRSFIDFLWGINTTVSQFETRIGIKIPRGLRAAPRLRVVKFLMGVESETSGFCSVQTTNDALGALSRYFKAVYRIAAFNRRLSSTADVPAVAVLYSQEAFSHVEFVSGSW